MRNMFLVVKKYWWVLLILLLIGGFLFYRSNKSKAAELKEKSYTVKRQDLVDSLDISGEVDAHEKATLKFQTSGLLTWVGVKEGDMVKKFQVLASLDKRELQNSMNQLLNDYSKARADFDQTQYDNRDWISNTREAQDAIKRVLQKEQMDLTNAVLDVEAKNLALKFANLYTPIAGIVTKIDAPLAGQNITPTTATFEVINPESLYFSATADQTEVTKFKVGQKGKLILDSFPDEEVELTLQSVGFVPKAGESGTVYELKMSFASPSAEVRMGMTGDVKFVFEEHNQVLAIPAAFIKKNGGPYVTVMENGKKLKREIKIGKSIEGMVEVVEGIKENEVIYSN